MLDYLYNKTILYTSFSVVRCSKTGIEEGELSAKRAVLLSLRVEDGGELKTQRVTGKYPEKS